MGGWELKNALKVVQDLENIEQGLTRKKAERALKRASEPMLSRMAETAPVRSNKLKPAIKAGRIQMKRGRASITLGVHGGAEAAKYAHLVEFGHGGPHPAPPHPFMRPAYDETVDESYGVLRQTLKEDLLE